MSYSSLATWRMLAKYALALGREPRATFHEDGIRRESVAEHTVMLMMLILDLHGHFDFDLGAALAYTLVHDLPEVYAHDTNSINLSLKEAEAKRLREAGALVQLESECESGVIERLIEYERREISPDEAAIVHFLDKVAPKVVQGLNGGAGLEASGLTPRDVQRLADDQLRKLEADLRHLPRGLADRLRAVFESAAHTAVQAFEKRLRTGAPAARGPRSVSVGSAAPSEAISLTADWTCELHDGIHVAWSAERGPHCPLCELEAELKECDGRMPPIWCRP